MRPLKTLLVLPALALLLVPARAFCQEQRDAEYYFNGALTAYEAGDQTDTLNDTSKAIQMKPDLARAYALRGAAKLREVRLYDALYIEGKGGMSMWEGGVVFGGPPYVKVPHVDLDGALDDLTKAIALKPDYTQAYDCRGLVKYFKGDVKGAIADFTLAIKARADYAPAWSNRGHAELVSDDAKSALADLDKAVALQPDLAVAWGNRAMVKQSTGDLAGALADINKAIDLKPDYHSALNFRGILKQVNGDAAGATADFTKAANLGDMVMTSNMDIIYDDPTLVKQAAGDMDGALADLEEPVSAPAGDAKLREEFAQAYFARASNPPRGGWFPGFNILPDLDKAIALEPDFGEAYRLRGLTGRNIPVNDDEFDVVERGPETDPMRDMEHNPDIDGPDAYQPARKKDAERAIADLAMAEKLLKKGDKETYIAEARLKLEVGDAAGALPAINKAIELSPGDSWSYKLRGDIEKQLGDEKASLADAMHALDLDVARNTAPSDTAKAYTLRADEKRARKDTAGALADYASAIAAMPQYAPAYYGRARLNYDQGKMEGVMDDLNKATDHGYAGNESIFSDAHYLRGVIERDKGDMDAALTDFKSTFPNDPIPLCEAALIEQAKQHDKAANEDFTKALYYLQIEPALRLTVHHGSEYDRKEAGYLDGVQAGLDKVAALKGTPLETILNHVAGMEANPFVTGKQADEFTTLIAVRPGMGALHFMRGMVYFGQGAQPAALADFRKTLALGNVPAPSLTEAHLLIWVIRAQSGDEKAATGELQAWLDSGKPGAPDAWHARIARFLTGKLAEEDFLKAAAGNDISGDDAAQLQDCEAYFYAGAKRLAAGDKAAAADYFNKSASVRRKDTSLVYPAAWAEVALLKPAP